MTENELKSIDRKNVWHPYASMTTPPPVNFAVSAEGTRIVLDDGTELIDAISSWWCMCHGHRHPKIVEAVRKQMETLPNVMFAGFTHEPAIRLTEHLIRHTPAGLNKVFYADSGSVAVECALKLALQYQYALGKPERNRFATVRGGYHGDTTGAMAVSDPEGMHTLFSPLMVKHFFAPMPKTPFGGVWNDADFEPMRELLERHSSEIAGVILEPVFQGANAMRFYHPEYLRKLRAECDRLGIVLIFDEVATGFGRTGEFFALDYAGVAPDAMCVGKGLVGGTVGLAAVVASEKVARTVSEGEPGKFMHGPTFMANPIACAAGCASLELFDEYDWKGNVRRIGRLLEKGLEPFRSLPAVRDVRSLGAVGVVELDRIPSPETMAGIVRETGVWLRPFGNWLYTMPPFITADSEMDAILNAMEKTVRSL